MNPDVLSHPSVLVAVVALALSAAAIWAAREVAPSSGAVLASVVGRLVDAGNGSRAYKLCLAAPRLAALAGIRAMLDAVTGRSAGADDPAGYRDGSSRSVEAFQQKLRDDFDAAASGPLRALTLSGTLSLLGLAAAMYALAIGLAEPGQRVEWAGALVATLGAQAWGLWSRWTARRHTRLVREGLVEPMTRSWQSGSLVGDASTVDPVVLEDRMDIPDMAEAGTPPGHGAP